MNSKPKYIRASESEASQNSQAPSLFDPSTGRPAGQSREAEGIEGIEGIDGDGGARGATVAHPSVDPAWFDAVRATQERLLTACCLDEVLALALRRAAQALDSPEGMIWLIDGEGGKLRPAVRLGAESGSVSPWPPGMEAAERAVRRRCLVHDRIAAGAPAAPPVEALIVPLQAYDTVLGAMALLGPRSAAIHQSGRRGTGQAGAREDGHAAPDAEAAPAESWCGPAGEGLLTVIAGQLAMAIHLARVQQKLAQAEARLRDAETDRLRCEKLAALGEISAKLAHEIRNPLSAIGGFARRIQKGLPANDPNGDYASIIVREIERLEAMVAEQLQFAKPIAPRVAMVDLNEVVRAAVQIAREEAEGRGIDLREQYQGGIPPMLLAPDRLEQVLLNIVRNAMQSTREGQRIAVMTRATEGWAQIDVANNGERLEAEALERLFIPFASGRSAGSGLGLAIADQIVREHGGEIRVRTDPSWSVIFTVSLPIRSNAERRRGQDRRRRNRDRAA